MSEINLIQGDCLEKMKGIESGSVDLVLTDPPYNIGKAEWDKIPNYVEWCGKWFLECQRVLKDNGSFYFFHNDMVQIAQLMEWLRKNTNFVFKQLITWSKIDENFKNKGFVKQRLSVGSMRNYYGGFTEYCLFYTFQPHFVDIQDYFSEILTFIGLSKKDIIDIVGQQADHCFRVYTNQWLFPTKTTYNNLIDKFKIDKIPNFIDYEKLLEKYTKQRYTFNTTNVCSTLRGNLRGNSNTWVYENQKSLVHPTQKPLNILENILSHSSNENTTILDPFMGSGSTGVACVNLNRNFIGIELDKTYFEIAEKRISEAQENKKREFF